MSFKQCSELPPELKYLETKIKNVCEALAATTAERQVYSYDALMDLIRSHTRSGAGEVYTALMAINVIGLRTYSYCSECEFDLPNCICDSPQPADDERYEVIGDLDPLLDALIHTVPSALPYFISFYTQEGLQAAKDLHHALGGRGFLSADNILSGEEWRNRIADNLRSAKTFFMLESQNYHTSAICELERNFAVASGKRVLRIGLTQRSHLKNGPAWLDTRIQYEEYLTAKGDFDLSSLLARANLPDPLSLDTRRNGVRALIGVMHPTYMDVIADEIGGRDKIPTQVDNAQKALALLDFACKDASTANLFCMLLNFSELGM